MTSLKQILSSRGIGLSEQEHPPAPKKRKKKVKIGKAASEFITQNKQGTTRVFVAGGSRSGISKLMKKRLSGWGKKSGDTIIGWISGYHPRALWVPWLREF